VARFNGSVKTKPPGGGKSKSLASLGAPSNVNHDRTAVLHAPRLKAIPTRNYGKGAPTPSAYPDPTGYGAGAGFSGIFPSDGS
jgi:hypothetical protein